MSKSKKRWDRYAIRAAVHRKGKTLKKVAEDAGLDEAACRVALIRKHEAGERAIADFLEMDPAVLWPSRYPTSEHVSPAGSKTESAASASPIGGGI